MDIVPLVFYAIVCTGLTVLTPGAAGILRRALTGAFVGAVAAISLPVLRGLSGF